jgi:adsorption protein A
MWLERATELENAEGSVWLELAYAYRRAQREAAATHALEEAVARDPQNEMAQLELGYAYWRDQRPALAEHAFEQAWQDDAQNPELATQLVYANQRLGRNGTARFYAERALDHMAGAERLTAADQDRQFGLQRLHEDLGRRATVSLDAWSGTTVGSAVNGPEPVYRYRSYSQMEFEYRLGSSAIRDNRSVAAYGRLLADGGDTSRSAPVENSRVGVGLRWKPFSSQVFFVAAEHQRSLNGDPRADEMLRASASFLNGGRHSDDWHAAGSGWMAYSLYLDAAQYVRSHQTAGTGDLRASAHMKIASRQTIEPFGHVQASTRTPPFDRDVRFGVGTRWNLWHGRSQYDADPGKLSLGMSISTPSSRICRSVTVCFWRSAPVGNELPYLEARNTASRVASEPSMGALTYKD